MINPVQILNDGPDGVEVTVVHEGVSHMIRPRKGNRIPIDIIVLAMAAEIEELREALEADRDDLVEAIHELENLKRECETGFTNVLDKLGDRGKTMTA